MATADTPDIRGSLRAELIRDLALGELTHEQLAEKYGPVLSLKRCIVVPTAQSITVDLRPAKQGG